MIKLRNDYLEYGQGGLYKVFREEILNYLNNVDHRVICIPDTDNTNLLEKIESTGVFCVAKYFYLPHYRNINNFYIEFTNIDDEVLFKLSC